MLHAMYSPKDNPRMGLIHFVRKIINVLLKWTLFLAGPHIQAIQILCQLCSNVGPIKFCKRPINISNGPLKFGNLHAFEWNIGPFKRPIIILG